MTPERQQRIRELFEAALGRPAEQRAAFLATACKNDIDLRQRVEALLTEETRDFRPLDRAVYQAPDAFGASNAPSEDSHSFIGEMIGTYRVIREVGRGGMGKVYLAFDTRLGRQAALKLLPSHLVNNPELVRRFQREARAASALNHPNIITIHDFGQKDGRYYIVSEFVEGCTLRDLINNPDTSFNQILDLGAQVASALDTAHAAGIIHRDIKPENIMLRPDGYVKVLDFGLAKLAEREHSRDEAKTDVSGVSSDFETQTGTVLGTVSYMSPEQARGQKVDGRSDLFSLGVVLYELITAKRPFAGETWHHTIVAITDAEPPPISRTVDAAPAGLQTIIDRALAKNVDQRYQTAGALLADLKALESEVPDSTRIQRIAEDKDAAAGGKEHVTVAAARMTATTDEGAGTKVTGQVAPTGMKRRKLVTAIAILALAAAVAYLYFAGGFGLSRSVLTSKDPILLADFVNNTGDVVFDGPLKQGLSVQLAQSPFLNIYPEERARETLRLMERSHDEKITLEIGREICQRRGIKALLVGTIDSLGRNYVITLEAVNSQNGDSIARQQIEADSKEKVLSALGRASTAMREQLGESLVSIRKFDAPIEQATTASLEAFKDYALGIEFRHKGEYAQSVPALKRAVDRDNEFALAHARLGVTYRDLRNLALGNKHLERGYELRDRVSERERLEISAIYFRHITGELDKRIETSALLTQTYPQDPYGYHIHGNSLMVAGEFEQAAKAYRAALELDPDYALSRANLALALIGLNRFDEADATIRDGLARGQDSTGFHNRLYLIAFLKGDSDAMQRHVLWFASRGDEYQMRETQARAFAFAGRWRQASEAFAQAAALAESRGLLSEKARIMANDANLTATFGLTRPAAEKASVVLALLEKDRIGHEEMQPSLIGQLDSQPVAWTLALCGNGKRAQAIADGIARDFPLDTMQNAVWLPLTRATLELKSGSAGAAGATDRAIQLLQAARRYEAATFFKPVWLRGVAYLDAKNGALAAAEFQKIIDHRGWDVLSPLWPMAHLGLARAAALQGDVAKSRQAYEKFSQLWKDADADLPILIAAKREFER